MSGVRHHTLFVARLCWTFACPEVFLSTLTVSLVELGPILQQVRFKRYKPYVLYTASLVVVVVVVVLVMLMMMICIPPRMIVVLLVVVVASASRR